MRDVELDVRATRRSSISRIRSSQASVPKGFRKLIRIALPTLWGPFTRFGHRKESAMSTASALAARLDASYEAVRIRGCCGVTTEFLFERRALMSSGGNDGRNDELAVVKIAACLSRPAASQGQAKQVNPLPPPT